MTTSTNDWRAESEARNAMIDARLAELGLSLSAEFVPASRFKDDEWRRGAVNFTVTVTKGERAIYSGPYAYGIGHLPGYVAKYADKLMAERIMIDMRERGVWPIGGLAIFNNGGMPAFPKTAPVPAPLLRDVMRSLLSDAGAIDHGSFESWAGDYGYDTDSRKAEQTYRACLDTGLALRAALSDSVLAELREMFQDY